MIKINFSKDNKNINLKANICDNNTLRKYMKFEYLTNLCKEGCPNYNTNYTCPPNSPNFDDYVKNYKFSLVMVLYMNIPKDGSIADTHQYLRTVLSHILIPLEKKVDGLLTDGGRCLICQRCAYMDKQPCRFPEKMRFSMEAMGIELSKVSEDILEHSIMWNEEDENSYCSVMASVNFNDLDEGYFKDILLRLI